MKKFLLITVLLMALVVCFAACGEMTDTTEAPTTTGGDNVNTTTEITTTTPETTQPTPTTYSLKGKKFLFLGSSVTYGSASGGYSMADCLRDTEKCFVVKEAVSGTTLVDNGAESYVQRLVKTTNNMKKVAFDHVIVQLSTNDAGQNKPLGQISDSFDIESFDTSTVAGAIEYIIALSKETWGCHVSFYTGTKYNNVNYRKMVNLLLDIQEKWGIGVIDLYNDPEMNAVSSEDYRRFMANNGTDGVHPTRVGYEEWWTPKFKAHLEKYE